jgi:hypothetical protein
MSDATATPFYDALETRDPANASRLLAALPATGARMRRPAPRMRRSWPASMPAA